MSAGHKPTRPERAASDASSAVRSDVIRTGADSTGWAGFQNRVKDSPISGGGTARMWGSTSSRSRLGRSANQ